MGIKYYKDALGGVHGLEDDGSQDHLIGNKVAMTTAEVTAYLNKDAVLHFTNVTTMYIENKVQAYNQSNGLAFKDIDAFTKYAVNPSSPHYAIANQFISYADRVWTAVRTYQATATTVPTDSEFKTILDSVVF